MADAEKILSDIDAQWEAVKQKFIDAQDAYKSIGRYFQLLPTFTVAPKDGETKPPDKTAVKPSYMDKTTAQLVTQYGLTLPNLTSLEVHQYRQPNGVLGWITILSTQVTDDKDVVQTWMRTENLGGDESWRTTDWQMETAAP